LLGVKLTIATFLSSIGWAKPFRQLKINLDLSWEILSFSQYNADKPVLVLRTVTMSRFRKDCTRWSLEV
jgi:hypothetical protein